MIVISAALVVVAFGLLVAGITLSQIVLVYVSIGVSALAALLLGAGAFRQRHELLGRSAGASSDETREKTGRTFLPRWRKGASAPAAVGSAGTETGGSAAAASAPEAAAAGESHTGENVAAATATSERPAQADPAIPGDAPVSVLPTRRTYHLASCRQLRRARDTDELTYAEAHRQGYTACVSCLPDTVLAARGPQGSPGSQRHPHHDEQAADAPDGTAGDPADGQPDAATTSGSDRSSREPATAGRAGETGADDAEAAAAAEATPGDATAAPETAPEGEAGLVGVVHGSHRYHRLTCAVVEDAVNDGIQMTTMTRSEAQEQDHTPCTVCHP